MRYLLVLLVLLVSCERSKPAPALSQRDTLIQEALLLLQKAQKSNSAALAQKSLHLWQSLDGQSDSLQIRIGMARSLALVYPTQGQMNPSFAERQSKIKIHPPPSQNPSSLQWGGQERGERDRNLQPPDLAPDPDRPLDNRQPPQNKVETKGESKDW